MPEERAEVIRDEDGAEEEESLVEAVARSSAITVDSQGTTHGSVRIRHAHHFNTAASLTIL